MPARPLPLVASQLPSRAVLYFHELPLLGKTPDTTSTRGCEMSVGASENAFIITIVGSVLSQEEKKRGTVDFAFAEG
jgi:hypothetical protein